jgi:hypothetical protein
MCSTLVGDITTDYPLCLLILQPTFRFAFSVVTTTDSPLYSACRYYNRISADLSGGTPSDFAVCSTLSSDTTTVSPFCFACRFSKQLSAALLGLSILQLTVRSALSGVTRTHYPVCSLAFLEPTIPSALLYLTIAQPTVFCTLPADFTNDCQPLYSTCRYYN